ncbi:encapsulin, partial [Agromyces soli]
WRVLPLTEVRADFALSREERLGVSRGAIVVDLGALDEAALRIASVENAAVFEGWDAVGFTGIVPASPHEPILHDGAVAAYDDLVASAVASDVMPWARANLIVLQGAKYWTFAGYSNGAGCAAYFGAKYPEVFGNLLAISPVVWAGAERNDEVLQNVFGGDQSAYDAIKPATIMAAKAP